MSGAKTASDKAKSVKLSAKDYVHLHNHTQHSLLDGLSRIPDLVKKVKQSGMKSVAMTDHGTLSGAIDFYKAAKAEGINPIIGLETYVAARQHTDKDPTKDKARFHLILLAMNNTGYQNLMRLSTVANLDGYYYYPRIDHDLLEKHNEGLIALSACMSGEVGSALKEGDTKKAEEKASWYKKIFGDRYYLEVQDHGHPENPKQSIEQNQINQAVLKLGKKLDIPAVVTCDAHYLEADDEEAHEILLCVGTGSFLADENRMSLKDFPLFVEDPGQIIDRWGKENPELITNTSAIAERCNVDIKMGEYLIPKFPVQKGKSEKSYLDELTYNGLLKRYKPEAKAETIEDIKKILPKEVVERAEYELGVMDSMGFNGYFLIVQDFINWGKDQGIVFGPGRGSAAGSIVAYALKITEIEPLKYKLMFERFLNPDRISMPDIDIDIQDTRRDEVIQYCVDKYGKERVANIVTFGRMFARNAVRDVSRVLQVPYAEADRLAKMIPPPVQGRHIPLAKSLESDADLKNEYQTSKEAKRVLDLAVRLEGTIRSHGVHAAGLVIAPDDIVKFTPLEMAQKGAVTTQYAMGPIEELGLLKMDFLGLSNLTIIKNTLRIVKRVYGQDIDIEKVPLDDKDTFKLLQSGDTTGVFQLESSGMKRYLRELKPDQFEDIIAMVALYRPGPLAEIPRFIKGKNQPSSIEFLHESLEPILNDTYGVMVYQEQIINLLQMVAGYSAGEADLVRKAIGKKKRDIMQAEEPRFIKGCVKQGLSEKQAKTLWDQIQPFADYSFNKAHATCYAQIAYWTAYLKARFPEAFMAALMTSDYDNIDRLAIEITECRHVGIEVLQPDVNESFPEFAVVPDKKQIRFGLNAVKNVGSNAVEEIIRVREENGGFKSLEDFFSKVNVRIVNRKNIESLIKCGAFDKLGDRFSLLGNIDILMAFAAKLQKEAELGQTDLFGGSTTSGTTSRLVFGDDKLDVDTREALAWERELLGLYLSQHPLQDFESILEEKTVPLNQLKPEHDEKQVTIGGNITDIREITTKNGKRMAFVKLADQFSEIELIVFPNVFDQSKELWERDRILLVKGRISAKDRAGQTTEELKLLVSSAEELTHEAAKNYKPTGKKKSTPKAKATPEVPKKLPTLYVRLQSSKDQEQLVLLKKTLDKHAGESEVILVVGGEDKQAIRLPGRVDHESASTDLIKILGAEHVKVR